MQTDTPRISRRTLLGGAPLLTAPAAAAARKPQPPIAPPPAPPAAPPGRIWVCVDEAAWRGLCAALGALQQD